MPSAWHRRPVPRPLSEVTLNEDFKRFLQPGACQPSPPGAKSARVALLMSLAGRGRNTSCISLQLHLLERQGRAPSAALAAAPGPAPDRQAERWGWGHDEYFMPQSQTFSLTPEWRAQRFLVFVTVAGNIATGKAGWAPLAEKEPQPMLRLLMQKGAVGAAGPERGLHGSAGTRRDRTAHTGGQGSLCPR